MSDINRDVKAIVKAFIKVFVIILVKESTKKMIKSLTIAQKRRLEAKVKYMSDDQLAQYLDENTYFKNALQNTLKSACEIQSAKETGFLLRKLKSINEVTDNINYKISSLVLPSPISILSIVAIIVVFIPLAYTTAVVVNQELKEKPHANFSCNNTSGDSPLTVQFTDLSENATGWYWDFGDRTYSNETNPIHTYSNPDYTSNTELIYNVKLTVYNKHRTDSKFAKIKVLLKPLPPIANFKSDVILKTPLIVRFTDKSKYAKGWSWDFGDGTSSNMRNPIHTYFKAGQHPVNLTVTNFKGTDSMLATISLSGQTVNPVANFTSNVTNGTAPLYVQFTDRSQSTGGWTWDFGDGTNTTEKNPMHTYSAAGNYTIKLTVSCANVTDSKTAIINVTEQAVPPVANLNDVTKNGTNNATTNVTIQQSSSSRSSGGSSGSPGGSSRKTIFPVAKFSSNVVKGNVPLSVQFTDLSENTNKWYWDFGDGTNSLEKSPMHVYSAIGNYTVNLTVTSEDSYINSTYAIISVLKAAPEISWNNPADIVYGTLLNGTQLNAVASVDGSFMYTPENGSVLAAGTQLLEVNFIPNDTANYAITSKYVTINVSKAIPAISWSNPADIIYGTELSDTQLNASASVPGTFIYNPTRGDVLSAGTRKLSVDFTPDDTSNYTTASQNVTINVTKLPGPFAYVANKGSNNISVIDIVTNNVTDTVKVGDWPVGVALTPDGKKIYVANSAGGTVSIIDTATNIVTATVPVGTSPFGVAVTPDGKKIYVTNADSKFVSIIDTTTNNVIKVVELESNPIEIAVTPDGKKAYVTHHYSNNVSIIDTANDTVLKTIPVGIWPHGVAVNAAGTELYVVNSGSNTVSIIDTANNRIIATVNVGTTPEGVAVDPYGTKVYVTNTGSNTISVIDTATNNVTATIRVGNAPECILVNPTGTNVYVTNLYNNNVSVIDIANNTVIATINVGVGPSGLAM